MATSYWVSIQFFRTLTAPHVGWIFAWQYQILPLSLIVMIILLRTLILIYVRLNGGNSHASSAEKYIVESRTWQPPQVRSL
jgi:hypothetical protein